MFNFKNCITDIIKIYEQNATYKEKNISLTRSLEHYVKIKDQVFNTVLEHNLKFSKLY